MQFATTTRRGFPVHGLQAVRDVERDAARRELVAASGGLVNAMLGGFPGRTLAKRRYDLALSELQELNPRLRRRRQLATRATTHRVTTCSAASPTNRASRYDGRSSPPLTAEDEKRLREAEALVQRADSLLKRLPPS